MQKIFISFFSITLLFLTACGKDMFTFPSTKDVPVDVNERVEKNIEEGRGVSFGNGNFVATPYNVISFSKSSDGINWSDSQVNMGTLWDSEFGGYDEYFVSVGLSNLLVVSNDNGESFSSKTYTGVPSGGNLF